MYKYGIRLIAFCSVLELLYMIGQRSSLGMHGVLIMLGGLFGAVLLVAWGAYYRSRFPTARWLLALGLFLVGSSIHQLLDTRAGDLPAWLSPTLWGVNSILLLWTFYLLPRGRTRTARHTEERS